MPPSISHPNLLNVYIDADVLFRAATASHQYTAALVLLRMSEFTMIDAITAVHTVEEATRSLTRYLPEQTPLLLQLIARSVRTVDNPPPHLLTAYQTQAHWKDAINLAAAVHSGAHILVTYNLQDYYPQPGVIQVMPPGQLIAAARALIYETFSTPP